MARLSRTRLLAGCAASLSLSTAIVGWAAPAGAAEPAFAGRCAAVAALMLGQWPDASTQVQAARYLPDGATVPPEPFERPAGPPPALKSHCVIDATMAPRTGIDGQHYAIRFRLRLPENWNGRFLFQGGGGTNGNIGNALGLVPGAGLTEPAINQGYAVVSQDSGHDNASNSDPARGGPVAFGWDPEARRNYAYASLQTVAGSAKALISRFYGRMADHSYFAGCSKGGQEGLMAAHRFPDLFDGIVAGAPGMSLPRAALAQNWDVQVFGALLPPDEKGKRSVSALSRLFSADDFVLIRRAVLDACDGDDGLADGIISRYGQCSGPKLQKALESVQCAAGAKDVCVDPGKLAALKKSLAGPKGKGGAALYTEWPWDAGIGSPDWAVWKLGLAQPPVPPLNVVIGGAALHGLFSPAPRSLGMDPQQIFEQQLSFDFQKDGDLIHRVAAPFKISAWEEMSARSPDIDAFRARGGKLIVPHGVSDPVFSINDTLNWYQEMDERYGGQAAGFVRVFPVPGMGHCSDGPATDRFAAFQAMVDWVERGQAPDSLTATAGPQSPWPGRTRPLCPYPTYARYDGTGNKEAAESFQCVGGKKS
ncbi:feruloyl esterase [Azospirillum sp. RU38E]|nr:feruloyl esterase [Azospirillum sp. RU38E]SNS36102.1 feruloyl esterase [Azospirillum sp. RU37A]